jgi:hypothetical protein
LQAGSILNAIVRNIKNKISGDLHQLFVYAVNDNYITAMHNLLNISGHRVEHPPFGAGYIFELRQDAKGNAYIQILYKNNTNINGNFTLHPVQIEGCGGVLCPLNTFDYIIADKVLNDFEQQCSQSIKTVNFNNFSKLYL